MRMEPLTSAAFMAACLFLGGCGVVAVPCRVASAGLKALPIIGHPLASPTDACADAIDPPAETESEQAPPGSGK